MPPRKKTVRTPKDRPRAFADVLAGATPRVAAVAKRLRRIVLATLPKAEEGIYGGSKVRLALYLSGGTARVVCGILPGKDRCGLFLHRVAQRNVPELELVGKGKHALRVGFAHAREVPEAAVRRALKLSTNRLKG